MKLLLLPGFEEKNDSWADEIQKNFIFMFDSVSIIKPTFNNSKFIDESNLDLEVQNLINFIESCDDKCVIFARKFGVLIALKAISMGEIKPLKCVFFQMPIIWARINNLPIDDWLYGYDVETLFIKEKEDMDFYYDEMRNYLEKYKIKYFQLVELESLDNNFINFQKKFVLDYLI